MVSDDQQVVAPLCEVTRQYESPNHREGFTFDRRISCSADVNNLEPSSVTLQPYVQQHRRIQGGPGGHVPPLDYLKLSVFFELFICWCTCLAKLAYRFMNIAGDERMCGKYLSRASESGRLLEM